ncbi:uncharacterized protein VTP21DRAFT_9701 [Calcarisporiella thermophila]|uniref:uncharacterized protein n=1 Tax=Calcarisporiella thermophila TaxID=911321 RepID=UPI003743045E
MLSIADSKNGNDFGHDLGNFAKQLSRLGAVEQASLTNFSRLWYSTLGSSIKLLRMLYRVPRLAVLPVERNDIVGCGSEISC